MTEFSNLGNPVRSAARSRPRVDPGLAASTLGAALRRQANTLLSELPGGVATIVAVEPATGRVVALAERPGAPASPADAIALEAFPAASLFKLVTAAAALERAGLRPEEVIRYRGRRGRLTRRSSRPSRFLDLRRSTFSEALAESCNPVFARIASLHLRPSDLAAQAMAFGFEHPLPFEAPIAISRAPAPTDELDFARTAAGFGEVTVSPLHAALIAGAIANGGLLMRPSLAGPSAPGATPETPEVLRRAMAEATARALTSMMVGTVTRGTARGAFSETVRRLASETVIAGKTGTLAGRHPWGTVQWFAGAAVGSKRSLALACLVVDAHAPRGTASVLASRLLDFWAATGARAGRRDPEPAPSGDRAR